MGSLRDTTEATGALCLLGSFPFPQAPGTSLHLSWLSFCPFLLLHSKVIVGCLCPGH